VSSKEWLAAIGALSMSLNAAEAQQPAEGRAGVAAAVNTTATGLLAGSTRTLFIGNDVFKDERITTDAGGRAQLLFLDQSAVTVGPNAELVIDRFVYDEKSRLGTLAVQASRGLIRFVGGDISKQQDVLIRTPVSLIGIRGGISLIKVDQDGGTQAIFLFGSQLTVTSNQGGQTQLVTRPGFGVTVRPGQPPDPPTRVPGNVITEMLAQLEAPPVPNAPGLDPAVGAAISAAIGAPGQIAPDRVTRPVEFSLTDLTQIGNTIVQHSNQLRIRNVLSTMQSRAS
jgi:hypothetical protein